MVGLGECEAEVQQLLRDIAAHAVDVATIGQYLQPSRRNLPVSEYVSPEQFGRYRDYGESLGLRNVFSGPFVRSSYMADAVNEQTIRCA
jgi:lipoic acid synthetase